MTSCSFVFKFFWKKNGVVYSGFVTLGKTLVILEEREWFESKLIIDFVTVCRLSNIKRRRRRRGNKF